MRLYCWAPPLQAHDPETRQQVPTVKVVCLTDSSHTFNVKSSGDKHATASTFNSTQHTLKNIETDLGSSLYVITQLFR